MSLAKQIKIARKALRSLPKSVRDLMYWEGTGPFLWERQQAKKRKR